MEEMLFMEFGGTKKRLLKFLKIYPIIAAICGIIIGIVAACADSELFVFFYVLITAAFSIIPATLIAWLVLALTSSSKMMAITWTLKDDNILVGKKVIPLAAVCKIEHGTPKTKMGDGTLLLHMYDGNFQSLIYPHKRSEDGAKVAAYIEAKVSENLELDKKEYRMRCNVCGKVFCYKLADLRRNLKYSNLAKSSANMAVVNAIGGTQLGMYAELNDANRFLDKIVDYGKCPECNSTDLTQLADDEFTEQPASPSSADELKKFKELLDSGVITQEEFDAKKKQLLGL